jgi:heat shock protein HslJ
VLADFTDAHEPLLGTSWRMITLKDGEKVVELDTDRDLGFSMDRDGSFEFSTPCNGGGGEVEVGEGSMEFGPAITTLMGCDRRRERLQDEIQAIFTGEAEYRFEGPQLVVVNGKRALRLDHER